MEFCSSHLGYELIPQSLWLINQPLQTYPSGNKGLKRAYFQLLGGKFPDPFHHFLGWPWQGTGRDEILPHESQVYRFKTSYIPLKTNIYIAQMKQRWL